MTQSGVIMQVTASKMKASGLVMLVGLIGGLLVPFELGAWTPVSRVDVGIGVFLAAFFAVITLRALFLIVSPTPLLIIETGGIKMEPALFGNQLIPWSQVQEVRYRQVRVGLGPLQWTPRHWLRFTVVNAQAYSQQQNVAQRTLAYIWRASYMVHGNAFLNSGITSVDLERTCAIMNMTSQRYGGASKTPTH